MNSILCVEIDNNCINITETFKKGILFMVSKHLSLKVASGIENGKILDIDLIANLVKNELNKNNIKTKKAVFVVNSDCVITRKLRLPLLKDKDETISMLRFELEQTISVDLRRYKIIYKVTDIDDVNSVFYVIYCLPEDIYNSLIKLSKKLKLKLLYTDVSFNCLNKISEHGIKINNSFLDSNNIFAFANIDSRFLSFCVLNKGINDFSRISFYNDEKHYAFISEKEQSENSSYMMSASSFRNSLLDEINKYIRYYYSIDNNNYINKLYIYGSCSCNDIAEFLSDSLKIDVEKINKISDIAFVDEYNYEDLNEDKNFISVLSLLNGKGDVCFPTNTDEFKNAAKFYSIFAAASLVIAIPVIYAFIHNNARLLNNINDMSLYVENEDNAKLNNDVEALKAEVNILEDYKNRAFKLESYISGEDYVSSSFFKEILYAVPENTRVDTVYTDKNTTQLSCVSLSVEEVAIFLHNLREIEYIEETHMPYLELKQEGNSYAYSVICKLKDVKGDD